VDIHIIWGTAAQAAQAAHLQARPQALVDIVPVTRTASRGMRKREGPVEHQSADEDGKHCKSSSNDSVATAGAAAAEHAGAAGAGGGGGRAGKRRKSSSNDSAAAAGPAAGHAGAADAGAAGAAGAAGGGGRAGKRRKSSRDDSVAEGGAAMAAPNPLVDPAFSFTRELLTHFNEQGFAVARRCGG
jgi:hypothetical protein